MTNLLAVLFGDRDAKKSWDAMEARARVLPRDFRATYEALKSYLWTFTADHGTDIVAALARILTLFETSAADGKKATDLTGTDLAAFADGYLPGPRPAYETSWRDKLNRDAAKNRG